MMPKEWPFEDPPNTAVLTVWAILDGSLPILRVRHDADDGGWQFLTGGPVSEKDAAIVALGEMVERDDSLRELADLPEGWIAERNAPSSAWERSVC